ncbi:hypothetical protein GGS23DRAFT_380974 [Durotheca rogersii]|uniref:uncharacterized protein n=1 Tax=Durotheca rogersii TaxID=419775 RepID=UPI00221FAFD4|nr:uncharacterized protein GGS23DRAFT_380974 [Durotheca rogersii]KAI5866313.1 hypothetical protein GGS23DRAFT_380974 [Durotheca rogersii]
MAAPLVSRMQLWEIDDQSWFPPFLRAYVQAGLTHTWTVRVPLLQARSPATAVADTLRRVLGERNVGRYTYIDFCSGAGGPTPSIERTLNQQLLVLSQPPPPPPSSSSSRDKERKKRRRNGAAKDGSTGGDANGNGSASRAPDDGAVQFVLTDLHPNVESWAAAAAKSEHLTYVPQPIDAADAPPDLLRQCVRNGGRRAGREKKGVFRLFNLAFHHFDDDLARGILKNTVETSDGFGIFELQDRSLGSVLSCLVFGLGILLLAPLLYWRRPARLFWVYVVPVVPFVLVFDAFISSLRTRTAPEVEELLRGCGADPARLARWRVRSGRELFLWPCGYMSWIICTKEKDLARG